MKNYLLQLKYMAKIAYNDKITFFWVFFFPFLLATCFFFAFGNINSDNISKINIGLDSKSKMGIIYSNIPIFNIKNVKPEDAEKELKNKDIELFIDKDGKILTNSQSTDLSIASEVISEINGIKATAPAPEKLMEVMSKPQITTGEESSNPSFIAFISLVSLNAIYGCYSCVGFLDSLFNKSKNAGARIINTPISNKRLFSQAFIVTSVCSFFSLNLLIIFIDKVLKMNIFTAGLIKNLPINIIGIFFGLSLGLFISGVIKGEGNKKINILTTLLNFLSFTSGLLGPQVRSFVSNIAPFYNKINPCSIISQMYIDVNQLGIYHSVYKGSMILLVMSAFFIIVGNITLRRQVS